jgi:hypothetical protein
LTDFSIAHLLFAPLPRVFQDSSTFALKNAFTEPIGRGLQGGAYHPLLALDSSVKQKLSLMETTHQLLRYYTDRQCSRQWSSFLLSLGQELGALAEPSELRSFVRQVGKRMATLMPLPKVDVLGDLQAAMNQQWDRIGWGWVSLQEKPKFLVIVHSAAPLQSAFGDGSLSWSPALLEGIYEHWFAMAGAGGKLRVFQDQSVPSAENALTFEFRLSPSSQNEACQDTESKEG